MWTLNYNKILYESAYKQGRNLLTIQKISVSNRTLVFLSKAEGKKWLRNNQYTLVDLREGAVWYSTARNVIHGPSVSESPADSWAPPAIYCIRFSGSETPESIVLMSAPKKSLSMLDFENKLAGCHLRSQIYLGSNLGSASYQLCDNGEKLSNLILPHLSYLKHRENTTSLEGLSWEINKIPHVVHDCAQNTVSTQYQLPIINYNQELSYNDRRLNWKTLEQRLNEKFTNWLGARNLQITFCRMLWYIHIFKPKIQTRKSNMSKIDKWHSPEHLSIKK